MEAAQQSKVRPLQKKDYGIEEEIYEMILELESLQCSREFRKPVDWVALNIPDYPQIIKRPMDWKTLKVARSPASYSCSTGSSRAGTRASPTSRRTST